MKFRTKIRRHASGTAYINIPKQVLDMQGSENSEFFDISISPVKKQLESANFKYCLECGYQFNSEEEVPERHLRCPACGGEIENE